MSRYLSNEAMCLAFRRLTCVCGRTRMVCGTHLVCECGGRVEAVCREEACYLLRAEMQALAMCCRLPMFCLNGYVASPADVDGVDPVA